MAFQTVGKKQENLAKRILPSERVATPSSQESMPPPLVRPFILLLPFEVLAGDPLRNGFRRSPRAASKIHLVLLFGRIPPLSAAQAGQNQKRAIVLHPSPAGTGTAFCVSLVLSEGQTQFNDSLCHCLNLHG